MQNRPFAKNFDAKGLICSKVKYRDETAKIPQVFLFEVNSGKRFESNIPPTSLVVDFTLIVATFLVKTADLTRPKENIFD